MLNRARLSIIIKGNEYRVLEETWSHLTSLLLRRIMLNGAVMFAAGRHFNPRPPASEGSRILRGLAAHWQGKICTLVYTSGSGLKVSSPSSSVTVFSFALCVWEGADGTGLGLNQSFWAFFPPLKGIRWTWGNVHVLQMSIIPTFFCITQTQ